MRMIIHFSFEKMSNSKTLFLITMVLNKINQAVSKIHIYEYVYESHKVMQLIFTQVLPNQLIQKHHLSKKKKEKKQFCPHLLNFALFITL